MYSKSIVRISEVFMEFENLMQKLLNYTSQQKNNCDSNFMFNIHKILKDKWKDIIYDKQKSSLKAENIFLEGGKSRLNSYYANLFRKFLNDRD